MKSWKWLFALLGGLVLTACSQPANEPAPQEATKASHPLNPFPNASSVKLFVEVDWDDAKQEPVWSKQDGTTLNAGQRARLESSLMMAPPPEEMVGCFIPHHFFRYYDVNGKQLGEIAVCFCCTGIRASGSEQLSPSDGLYLEANFRELEALVKALGEPTNVQCMEE